MKKIRRHVSQLSSDPDLFVREFLNSPKQKQFDRLATVGDLAFFNKKRGTYIGGILIEANPLELDNELENLDR